MFAKPELGAHVGDRTDPIPGCHGRRAACSVIFSWIARTRRFATPATASRRGVPGGLSTITPVIPIPMTGSEW